LIEHLYLGQVKAEEFSLHVMVEANTASGARACAEIRGEAAEKNARWVPLDRPIVVERADVPQVFSDPYLSLQISFLNAS
jgi:hypothetical protein